MVQKNFASINAWGGSDFSDFQHPAKSTRSSTSNGSRKMAPQSAGSWGNGSSVDDSFSGDSFNGGEWGSRPGPFSRSQNDWASSSGSADTGGWGDTTSQASGRSYATQGYINSYDSISKHRDSFDLQKEKSATVQASGFRYNDHGELVCTGCGASCSCCSDCGTLYCTQQLSCSNYHDFCVPQQRLNDDWNRADGDCWGNEPNHSKADAWGCNGSDCGRSLASGSGNDWSGGQTNNAGVWGDSHDRSGGGWGDDNSVCNRSAVSRSGRGDWGSTEPSQNASGWGDAQHGPGSGWDSGSNQKEAWSDIIEARLHQVEQDQATLLSERLSRLIDEQQSEIAKFKKNQSGISGPYSDADTIQGDMDFLHRFYAINNPTNADRSKAFGILSALEGCGINQSTAQLINHIQHGGQTAGSGFKQGTFGYGKPTGNLFGQPHFAQDGQSYVSNSNGYHSTINGNESSADVVQKIQKLESLVMEEKFKRRHLQAYVKSKLDKQSGVSNAASTASEAKIQDLQVALLRIQDAIQIEKNHRLMSERQISAATNMASGAQRASDQQSALRLKMEERVKNLESSHVALGHSQLDGLRSNIAAYEQRLTKLESASKATASSVTEQLRQLEAVNTSFDVDMERITARVADLETTALDNTRLKTAEDQVEDTRRRHFALANTCANDWAKHEESKNELVVAIDDLRARVNGFEARPLVGDFDMSEINDRLDSAADADADLMRRLDGVDGRLDALTNGTVKKPGYFFPGAGVRRYGAAPQPRAFE